MSDLYSPEAAEPGRPFWWDGLTWPACAGDLPDRVDLLVIGAGYTGLSAALEAHDAGVNVAVIEAGAPGAGASTRNGGMVGAHPRFSWEDLAQSHGRQMADAIFAEAKSALAWVEDLIAREGITCDYRRTGRIQLAYTQAQFDGQRALAAKLGQAQVPVELVEKPGLAGEIATPLYKGGLLYPEHGGLHPGKYHLGLLQAVLGRGVPVLAHTRAEGIAAAGAGKSVMTGRGEIRADKVLLATNGYTTRPFHWFARRVFPVPSFLIATEPLSPNLIAHLAPGGRMMVETRARHSYFRISPDGSRIIFGGRAALVPMAPERAAKRLFDTMVQIWPDLAETRLTHVWTGNTGFSFGQMPAVGEEGGVHYAMGFSGSGTVMAPYLGAKAARQALGLSGAETAYGATGLPARWYHQGGAPHFLRGAEFWFKQVVDRQQDRAARKP